MGKRRQAQRHRTRRRERAIVAFEDRLALWERALRGEIAISLRGCDPQWIFKKTDKVCGSTVGKIMKSLERSIKDTEAKL